MKLLVWLVASMISCVAFAQNPGVLKLSYEENYTPTYDEIIGMYQLLDASYDNAVLLEQGSSDCGKPLHLFIINNKKVFSSDKIKKAGKSVLLINNGIHPGEPAGIDASLEFADDLLRNKDGKAQLLENSVVIIIPVYNIGGLLNRSAFNRSGQTTPNETGFRGNANNYDLNRDFVKLDSENAKSFAKIFRDWDPDVFLDTHTTNGSEHQYSITLIAPQPDKFPPTMSNFLREKLIPSLYTEMKKGEYELIPYVSWMYQDPARGINMTQESPRYSSGFANMFHSYGMMTENHVYKVYADRVKSAIQFIWTLFEFTSKNSNEIISSRKKGVQESMMADNFTYAYELDTTKFNVIEFKGYEVDHQQISKITGLPRFGYDISKPYTRKVPFFDSYKPLEELEIPEYYILPQGYKEIIERLNFNGVDYKLLNQDVELEVEVDYIDEYPTAKQPSNGHYFHDQISTRKEIQKIKYYKGDLIVPVRQERIKFLLETLEPLSPDSYFRWNFFDNILDAREYFSSYGFEENAMKYLNEHPDFKQKFQQKQANDTVFAKNHRAQLGYIYNNTEWAEITHKRYPVARITKALLSDKTQDILKTKTN